MENFNAKLYYVSGIFNTGKHDLSSDSRLLRATNIADNYWEVDGVSVWGKKELSIGCNGISGYFRTSEGPYYRSVNREDADKKIKELYGRYRKFARIGGEIDKKGIDNLIELLKKETEISTIEELCSRFQGCLKNANKIQLSDR